MTIVIFDIDGVIRDVAGSYRRAIADTVEHFTAGAYRPTPEDIDILKSEGIWNNDWQASQELVYRYLEAQGQLREDIELEYGAIVAFFQSRYKGVNPNLFDGYITSEPLLLQPAYLESLSNNNIAWGFFSGATRSSAEYVLKTRLGLDQLVLIAMEDCPGKPDPTGLILALEQLESNSANSPVIYVGDTVADMYTIEKAKQLQPERLWIGVGVLPPHVQKTVERKEAYSATLQEAGAKIVLNNVEELTPDVIQQIPAFCTRDNSENSNNQNVFE